MKVLSVCVGRPALVEWRGELVRTAIRKRRVYGPVAVTRLNLEGDEQADLTVHGGLRKAVYAYPAEHYEYWRRELPHVELEWGAFGENLTTEGLLEATLHIGDRLHIGTAEFVVTQPRMPCYKLNASFQRPDMVKRFLHSGFSGFYLAVATEGTLREGDDIALTRDDPRAPTIADVARSYAERVGD